MGLENRRKSIEKSDLDSFSESKWNNNPQKSREEELKDLKKWMDSLEEPIFSEQEAGKATIHTELEKKDGARNFDEISADEMLRRIESLFK